MEIKLEVRAADCVNGGNPIGSIEGLSRRCSGNSSRGKEEGEEGAFGREEGKR